MQRYFPLSFVLALSFSPALLAESPYIGGQIGVSWYDDACVSHALECNDDTFTFGLYGGYPLLSWLTIEAGVMDYGSADARYANGTVSADVWGLDASLLASHRIINDLDVYGRGGVAWLDVDKSTDESDQSFEPVLGVGLNYKLAPNWAVRGEYRFIDGIGGSSTDKADLHTFLVGVSYRFDAATPMAPQPIEQEVIPEPVVLPVLPIYTLELSELAFDSDSSVLSERGESQLNSWLPELQNSPSSIQITGHTDSTGSTNYNQTLSEQRAKSVSDYLISQGIDSASIDVKGMGERAPKASNTTPKGRSINRRVELQYEVKEGQ
ncbi:outer membrane beta-barrel protein [Vibrio sp. 10N.261.49.A12]|uniref:outer membrane beta-barrel protein n=1 Tax=Vibrio sp. 10N.261.49.A12 TaxID=3229667 RepID=UPI003553A0EF